MNTENRIREQISALTDSELCDDESALALAALRDPAHKKTWERYHQIGDILRSDELAIAMSSDFSERLAARLAEEPPYLFPSPVSGRTSDVSQSLIDTNVVAGMSARSSFATSLYSQLKPRHVASVIAVVVFMMMILLPNSSINKNSGMHHPSVVEQSDLKNRTPRFHGRDAAGTTHVIQKAKHAELSPYVQPLDIERQLSLTPESEDEMLRDPRIDGYLLAHQRYSSRMYSGIEYATRHITMPTNVVGR